MQKTCALKIIDSSEPEFGGPMTEAIGDLNEKEEE